MPSLSFPLPSLADLTEFALSVEAARVEAADWQIPAIDRVLGDLIDLLRDHYDLADDGDDTGAMMALTSEIAVAPDGWVDRYEDMLDGITLADSRADRAGW